MYFRRNLPGFKPAVFFLLAIFIASKSQLALAVDPQTPIFRLKSNFFPQYLFDAQKNYFNNNSSKCFESLKQIKITPYTKESEKYFLLRALCSPKELQPAAASADVLLALKEKGSSSDILYAAGLILSQIDANPEALKRFQEAIWFNSFKQFEEKDFYLDFGTLQYKLAMLGEANDSLIKAVSLGSKSLDAQYMLADISIKKGDRKNAILYSRLYKGTRDDVLSKETLLLALMVAVDPVFHKKDIAEAAMIAQNLKDSSITKSEVGIAATKALMLINNLDSAEAKLQKSLLANPADTRLQALDTQIKEERSLTPTPTISAGL